MINDCSVVIPTYFPGKIIEKLFESIPPVKEILVFDNSNDHELEDLIKNKYEHVKYIPTGDIGLGNTFNKALGEIKTNLMFITQPDVIIEKNCIENLILAQKKYIHSALLAPLIFENNQYSKYDHFDLKIDKNKKIKNFKIKNFKSVNPSGDIGVEAINSTSILIDRKKIKQIGGWDNYYYTYLEDVDLCYRVRKNNFEIIKVKNSIVNHTGFQSHKSSKHKEINIKRIFNFSKSSLYFDYKNKSKSFFYLQSFKNFIKIILKLLINIILFKKKKIVINLTKLKSYYYFFFLENFGKRNIQLKQ
jgi:GT2 family glycosyltransferase